MPDIQNPSNVYEILKSCLSADTSTLATISNSYEALKLVYDPNAAALKVNIIGFSGGGGGGTNIPTTTHVEHNILSPDYFYSDLIQGVKVLDFNVEDGYFILPIRFIFFMSGGTTNYSYNSGNTYFSFRIYNDDIEICDNIPLYNSFYNGTTNNIIYVKNLLITNEFLTESTNYNVKMSSTLIPDNGDRIGYIALVYEKININHFKNNFTLY